MGLQICNQIPIHLKQSAKISREIKNILTENHIILLKNFK